MNEQHTQPTAPPTSSGCGWAVWWTFVILVILAIAAFLVFPYTGIYNVAASAGHTALGRWYLSTTMEHSVKARAKGIAVPENLNNQSNLQTGFEHYDKMCMGCHGAPGVSRSETAQGMMPEPPLLTKSADNWTDAQVYWIIKNGVKMAGMPGFGKSHSEKKLWAMTAFVKQLPKITAEQYQQMKTSETGTKEKATEQKEQPSEQPPQQES